MEKNRLLKFINQYYLGGATAAVKWEAKDGGTSLRFVSADNNVIGEVAVKDLDFGDNEIGVYESTTLVKMLTVLDEKLDVSVQERGGKPSHISISDGAVDLTFMLADLKTVPPVPDLKHMPDMVVSIDITNDFRTRFIKGKSALPDATNFGVMCKDGNIELVVNYSSLNTNRIQFTLDGTSTSDMPITCFSANLFKEILTANKDATSGKFEVSPAGLAVVTFTHDSYDSKYYLVKLQEA